MFLPSTKPMSTTDRRATCVGLVGDVQVPHERASVL